MKNYCAAYINEINGTVGSVQLSDAPLPDEILGMEGIQPDNTIPTIPPIPITTYRFVKFSFEADRLYGEPGDNFHDCLYVVGETLSDRIEPDARIGFKDCSLVNGMSNITFGE